MKQGILEHLFCMVTLGLLCGWFVIILPLETFLVLHSLLTRSLWSGTLAAFLLSACYWPLDNRYPWGAFCNSWLFRAWRRYFDWTCVVEEPLDPARRYMFAEMPHGVVPLGAILSASVVRHAFPGVKHIAGVAANIVFAVPFIRHLYGWMGIRKAGKQSIRNMYEDGVQVAVVVGGIAEMFMVSQTEERIYLKSRKNFVRLSIQLGADIVPVYFFGNSLCFHIVGGTGVNKWLRSFSRWCKSALVFYYGRLFLSIPLRRPIKMVSGRPIRVEASADPDSAYVDAVQAELIQRVRDLHERHRPTWEHRPLIVY